MIRVSDIPSMRLRLLCVRVQTQCRFRHSLLIFTWKHTITKTKAGNDMQASKSARKFAGSLLVVLTYSFGRHIVSNQIWNLQENIAAPDINDNRYEETSLRQQ